jgi:hypothetical protein
LHADVHTRRRHESSPPLSAGFENSGVKVKSRSAAFADPDRTKKQEMAEIRPP